VFGANHGVRPEPIDSHGGQIGDGDGERHIPITVHKLRGANARTTADESI
jgi:hypothetical protein